VIQNHGVEDAEDEVVEGAGLRKLRKLLRKLLRKSMLGKLTLVALYAAPNTTLAVSETEDFARVQEDAFATDSRGNKEKPVN